MTPNKIPDTMTKNVNISISISGLTISQRLPCSHAVWSSALACNLVKPF